MNNDFYNNLSSRIIENDEFKLEYEKLQRIALSRGSAKERLIFEEIKRLVQSAAIFSMSDYELQQAISYKIAVFTLGVTKEKFAPLNSFDKIVELILIRLGNFPAVQHLIEQEKAPDYFSLFDTNNENDFNPFIWKEIIIKKIENYFELKGKTIYFTDFQSKVFRFLLQGKDISFSAPTSAGKSFLLSNYVTKIMTESTEKTIIYVVPSKALINQVQKDFLEIFAKYDIDDVLILNSTSDILETNLSKFSKMIFILTQERLSMLQANLKQKLDVDLLIVDEAQKVAEGERGIKLETTISDLIYSNPTTQKVFIAPHIENPQDLKTIFNVQSDMEYQKTSNSPVAQNKFLVDFSNKNVKVSLISNELGDNLPLFNINLDKKVPDSYKRKKWVVENLIKNEPTLVYCNTPSDCRTIANSLNGVESRNLDKSIIETIDFLKTHVHKDYYLIDLLKRGIAFHYGKIPVFVRLSIEELFKHKKIDIICCTSTILEGVNFPAKNLVIYKPKSGQITEMNDLTFLNLIGRAGRLTKDFYGNIYCIDINEWPSCQDALNGNSQKIESALDKTLKEKKKEILEHLSLNSDIKDPSVSTAVTRFLINELNKEKKLSTTDIFNQILTRDSAIKKEDLILIDKEVKKIAINISLNPDTILLNPSIDPRDQDALYKHLVKDSNRPLPIHPYNENCYHEMEMIFGIISKYFFKVENSSYKYFTFLAYNWIIEKPYSEILSGKIKYDSKKKVIKDRKRFINQSIEHLNTDIEDTLKYKYSRFLKCYIDILEDILSNEGEKFQLCNLPSFIESGACNKTTVILINLGISRTTAIYLAKYMPQNINNATSCLEWLHSNKGIIKEVLPFILFKEIELYL